MKSFLLDVVLEVINKNTDIENIVFVLPNQRAGVYLQKALKNELYKTTFFPQIITFDNLAEQIAGRLKTPSIELLFDFYSVYLEKTVVEKRETFEQFSSLATTILNDFNDIDAYLVNPKDIFSTLKEINKLHNWNPNTDLTKNYLSFFKNLEKYHKSFYQFLSSNQKGYQGLILRDAVMGLQHFISNTQKQYIFVGFNHLKKSEFQIIEELLAADRASVYFDSNKSFVKQNTSLGVFIKQHQTLWEKYKSNIFESNELDNFDKDKIEMIGIPKNVGMLKYTGELLKNLPDYNEVAIVLADQNVLTTALNSIPKTVNEVNITMGFPLKNFPISDLIKQYFELHLTRENAINKTTFYYKSVFQLLQHPLIRTHFKGVEKLTQQLSLQNKVYITSKEIKLHLDDDYTQFSLQTLFEIVESDEIQLVLSKINEFINFLKDKVSGFEKEVLYRHFQLNQQLIQLTTKYKYISNLKSLFQVYKQLLHSESVNFIGEPLQGLQIMGFLETQALDFKHILLTSMNEGVLPKGKHSDSFIPFDVRKHYGLLTYQEEDAIQAYHFYRLIQRAEKVSLLYNAQSDTFGGGEKSRFLTQLLWKYPSISQKIINPEVSANTVALKSIRKTPEIIEKLQQLANKGFSPSTLTSYLYNPIEFYHQKILGVKELEEVEETLAENTMGTVIHESLEELYKPFLQQVLDEAILKTILSRVTDQVKKSFKDVYKNGQYNQGKNKLIFEVIINFVNRFIKDEIKQIKEGRVIRILALEKPLKTAIHFKSFDFPINFGGIVDRIDEVDGIVRIVDYKSGKVEKNQLLLHDFSNILLDYKYTKALQVMLYAYMYSQQKDYDSSKKLQAGIVSFKNLNAGFIPINFGSYRKVDYSITNDYFDGFLEVLESLLVLIFDPTIPFIESE